MLSLYLQLRYLYIFNSGIVGFIFDHRTQESNRTRDSVGISHFLTAKGTLALVRMPFLKGVSPISSIDQLERYLPSYNRATRMQEANIMDFIHGDNILLGRYLPYRTCLDLMYTMPSSFFFRRPILSISSHRIPGHSLYRLSIPAYHQLLLNVEI